MANLFCVQYNITICDKSMSLIVLPSVYVAVRYATLGVFTCKCLTTFNRAHGLHAIILAYTSPHRAAPLISIFTQSANSVSLIKHNLV